MNGPQIKFHGNLTTPPVLRQTRDGDPVTTLRVATNTRRRNQDPETTYFNVALFRHDAQYAFDNMDTGTGVYIEGQFSLRRYTRQDGTPDVSLEIIATDFEISTRGAAAAALWAKHRAQLRAETPETDTTPERTATSHQHTPPSEADLADQDDPDPYGDPPAVPAHSLSADQRQAQEEDHQPPLTDDALGKDAADDDHSPQDDGSQDDEPYDPQFMDE